MGTRSVRKCGVPGLGRREFLKVAGLAGTGIVLDGPQVVGQTQAEVVPVAPKDTDLRPMSRPTRPLCANTPFGGPYYPSQESTRQLVPRALFDKMLAWPLEQNRLVFKFLNGQRDPCFARVHERIRKIAMGWCDYANLPFEFVDRGPCHLTINVLPFESNGQQFG